jgi:hypothetical protein
VVDGAWRDWIARSVPIRAASIAYLCECAEREPEPLRHEGGRIRPTSGRVALAQFVAPVAPTPRACAQSERLHQFLAT